MATFSQAISQIGSGHLDPYMTTVAYNYPHYGYWFYQDHFSLIMWPLSVLFTLFRTTFFLLVVQDLALVGSGIVIFRWGLEIVGKTEAISKVQGVLIGLGLLVILISCPSLYWAGSFDFHVQPLAILFALACFRDLWHNNRRVWVWVLLVLACGDVATTYLLVVALVGLSFGKDQRTSSLGILLATFIQFELIGLLGADKGSHLETDFAYLAHGKVPGGLLGLVVIGSGILVHPTTALRVIGQRFTNIFAYISAAGTVGLASIIGIIGFVTINLTNSLDRYRVFISPIAGFQNLAGVLFLVIGWVLVSRQLAVHLRGFGPSIYKKMATVMACAIVLVGPIQVLVGATKVPGQLSAQFNRVAKATSSELSTVSKMIPARAELVASQGIVGRFGDRRWVYPFIEAFPNGQTFPLNSSEIYFVLVPNQGIESATPSATLHAEVFLESIHAKSLVNKDGVDLLVLQEPKSATSLTIALP